MADSTDAASVAAGLLAEADALYAVPPAEFTAARDARAKHLRADEPALAAAVRKLRRPGTAAWAVNLLVRREPDRVAEILDVGEALREAQQGMDAGELRALTRQRRQLTAAVTGRARRHAAEAGQKLSRSVADQVEGTLTAAMLDAGGAAAVRSGLLVGPLAATGLDRVDAAAAVALPEALGFVATAREGAGDAGTGDGYGDGDGETRRPLRVVPDPDAEEKVRAAARERLADAEATLAQARSAADAAHAEVAELQARSMQLAAEADELRRQVDEIEARAEDVDEELAEAEEAEESARAALEEATHERDAAQRDAP